jgi:serine phosphatase RsbU (regulator of sigma subunit)/pSer/pThr/pTyr-binding forkhead associated (FHA) protein
MSIDARQRGVRLKPIGGPEPPEIEVSPDKEIVVGRSQRCDVSLPSDTVSRSHAQLLFRGGRWRLSDLGSRHGTFINGQPLPPHDPMVLAEGDLVRIGPYTYHVVLGGGSTEHSTITRMTDDPSRGMTRVEPVPEHEVERLARQRLDLLIDCAAEIHGAHDEQKLADAVLQSALSGTGFHHAALLRPHGAAGDEIEVIAHRTPGSAAGEPPSFSRSLISEAANTGRLVKLTEMGEMPMSVSIAELGITAALCAPILLGPTLAAFLYLDARGHGRPPEPDAVVFCQLIARMYGMALADIKRQDLEIRHRELHAEITAAREAQQFIVPDPQGTAGPIRYAMEMRPGRFVAGDLFDVLPLSEGRAAAIIGDVSGEGVGAGVIMAATQAHLNAALLESGDPVEAVHAANHYLAARLPDDKFVTMWVGIVDPAAGRLRYVDAGHGHWLLKPAGEAARTIEHEAGGYPLGIEPDAGYVANEIPIASGDRVVLYSDGVVEQRNAEGNEMFGRSRATEALQATTSVTDDLHAVIAAVEAFAQRSEFDDDTTVASVEVL